VFSSTVIDNRKQEEEMLRVLYQSILYYWALYSICNETLKNLLHCSIEGSQNGVDEG